ncbi:MAG: hypothetical protein AAFZ17_16070 [Cyanobacteria bacterium J06650_10]
MISAATEAIEYSDDSDSNGGVDDDVGSDADVSTGTAFALSKGLQQTFTVDINRKCPPSVLSFQQSQWTLSRSGTCTPAGALPTSGSRSP